MAKKLSNEEKDNPYFIDEEREKTLWEDAIFVFDSSAILAFYEYTTDGREELFTEVLDKIAGRLWITGHVEYEYLKNRKNKVENPINERIKPIVKNHLNPMQANLKAFSNHYKNIVDSTKPGKFPPSFESQEISSFQEVIDNILLKFNSLSLDINRALMKSVGD